MVLVFDIGVDYSGVSYALLDPGFVPQIKSVTKYSDSRGLARFAYLLNG